MSLSNEEMISNIRQKLNIVNQALLNRKNLNQHLIKT